MVCPQCGAQTTDNTKFCASCGMLVSNTAYSEQQVSNHSPIPFTPQQSYAGFWLRVAASLIDGVILGIASIVIGIALLLVLHPNTPHKEAVLENILRFFSIILNWLYFAIFESSAEQGTIGKRIIGIKVTDLNGKPISFWRATGRYFGKIISSFILLIGFIMAAFTEKKQALHDMLAGCLVVKK
jgi:uncharacterized RDD family membrane protein YckC